MQLHALTIQELRDLAKRIEAEEARRETIRVETAFIDDRVKRLEKLAAETGVIAFEEMPAGGHLPGQVVSYAKKEYRNVSGRAVDIAPGKRLEVWEELIPEPEPIPDDPEPDPDPDEPEEPDPAE